MSPDRGQECHSPAVTRRSGQQSRKSEDYTERWLRTSSPLTDAVVPEEDVLPDLDLARSRPHSHNNLRHKDDNITMDNSAYRHTTTITRTATTAASVKSMSSTENSRRDSAVSASSQHHRRPKTSRSTSKQSVRTVAGNELSQTVSRSSCRQRPRNQRFAGSGSGSVHVPPTNIEEALALHARSCSLFSTTSRPSTSHNAASTPSTCSPYTHPALHRSLSSADGFSGISHYASSHPISPYHSYGAPPSSYDVAANHDEEEQYYTSSFPPTVMHWTSDETRLREYAAIDRANTGVRGLLKRLLPRCVTRGGHAKFYDEKDGSDAGSVRRIRLDSSSNAKDEPKATTMRVPRHLGV